MKKNPRLSKFVDYQEYVHGDDSKSFKVRASRDGVRIEGPTLRVLGFEQARRLAETLVLAAEEANKRGAYPVVMQ